MIPTEHRLSTSTPPPLLIVLRSHLDSRFFSSSYSYLWKLLPITSELLLQTDKSCMTLLLLLLSNYSSLCPLSAKTSNLSFLPDILLIPTPFISTQPHWTRCSGGDVIRTDRNPLTSSNFAKWSRINAQVQICVEALERKDGAINMVWHRC